MNQDSSPALLLDIPEAEDVSASYSVSPRIHKDDFIYHHHIVVHPDPDPEMVRASVARYYFEDGNQSTNKLHDLIVRVHPDAARRRLSLLEFASGYGCLSRHLDLLRDQYDLVACDIHPQAVTFLQDVIGVNAVVSVSDPNAFHSKKKYDVVFALSFFSHMPPTTFSLWLRALFETVAEGGVLIFTTHGRVGHGNISQPALQPEGYWFAPLSEQKDLPTDEYGCMIATPSYVLAQLMRLEDAEFVIFEEASWWNTQDLFVIRRRRNGFNRLPTSPHDEAAVAVSLDLIQTFYDSTSWRITAPLRAIRKLFEKNRTRPELTSPAAKLDHGS